MRLPSFGVHPIAWLESRLLCTVDRRYVLYSSYVSGFSLCVEFNAIMHTPKSVPVSRSPFYRSLQRTKRHALIKAWEVSGLLVARYYAQLLRQHGHSPQALAERASDKDLEFYHH